MKTTDLSYLKINSNNNKDFISDMIRTFLKQTPEFIEELKGNIGNWIEFRKTFHKLKPTIKMMGMYEAEKIVRSIDELFDSTKTNAPEEQVMERFTKLEAECEKAYHELEEYLEKDKDI